MRVAVPINRKNLVAAVEKAEAKGALENLGILFETVASLYNQQAKEKISKNHVRKYVLEWKLPVKTQGKKGKRAATLTFDKKKLIAAITEAESAGPLANRSLLWTVVATLLDCKIHHVANAFRKWELSCTTPVGKRGRIGGVTGPRKPRCEKLADKKYDRWKAGIQKEFAKYGPNLVNGILAGRSAALRKANCLACVGHENATKEIRHCPVVECVFWSTRPYQKDEEVKDAA